MPVVVVAMAVEAMAAGAQVVVGRVEAEREEVVMGGAVLVAGAKGGFQEVAVA